MNVLLDIGHRASSPGARSCDGEITEFYFNRDVANNVALMCDNVVVDTRDDNKNGYYTLAKKYNEKYPDVDLIISLHLNSYATEKARGSEALYWHRNKFARKIAKKLSKEMSRLFDTVDRGAKPIKNRSERGYSFIKNTNATCIIIEPVFISNCAEKTKLIENKENYAIMLAEFIKNLGAKNG